MQLKFWHFFVGALALVLALYALGKLNGSSHNASTDDETLDPYPAYADSHAAYKLSTVIEGMPKTDEGLEREGSQAYATTVLQLDAALRATGLEPNEDTRSRAGSVLVAFQNEYNTPGWAVLECVSDSFRAYGDWPENIEFHEAAAICNVKYWSVGDRGNLVGREELAKLP